MAMDPSIRKILGYALLAGGLGAGGYLVYQHLRRQQDGGAIAEVTVETQPPYGSLALMTTQIIKATVSWLNPGSRPTTYGVQGAVVQQPPIGEPDLVGGRWWTSQAALTQASQGIPFGPEARVARVTVQPGQRGSVQLWSQPLVVPGEEWLFWVRVNPPADQLLVDDRIKMHKSALPKPDFGVVFPWQN